MKRLDIRSAGPFHILEAVFTALALVAVAIVIGPPAGHAIGLTGRVAIVVGVLIAVALDVFWVGAMRMLNRAIQERNTRGAAVMGGLALAAATASTALMVVLGHAGLAVILPGLALACTALRVYVDNGFADASTAATIAKRTAADRNARAITAADARHLIEVTEREAVVEIAERTADGERQIALATQAVEAQRRRNERLAALEAELSKSDDAHGEAAAAFLRRDLMARLAPPVLGAYSDVKPLPVDGERGAPGRAVTVRPQEPHTAPEAPPADGAPESAPDGPPQGEAHPVAPVAGPALKRTAELDDDELYEAGRTVWARMGKPRSQRRFVDEMRAAGHKAGTPRLRRLHGRLAAETVADATDVIGADVTDDEFADD